MIRKRRVFESVNTYDLQAIFERLTDRVDTLFYLSEEEGYKPELKVLTSGIIKLSKDFLRELSIYQNNLDLKQ